MRVYLLTALMVMLILTGCSDNPVGPKDPDQNVFYAYEDIPNVDLHGQLVWITKHYISRYMGVHFTSLYFTGFEFDIYSGLFKVSCRVRNLSTHEWFIFSCGWEDLSRDGFVLKSCSVRDGIGLER